MIRYRKGFSNKYQIEALLITGTRYQVCSGGLEYVPVRARPSRHFLPTVPAILLTVSASVPARFLFALNTGHPRRISCTLTKR